MLIFDLPKRDIREDIEYERFSQLACDRFLTIVTSVQSIYCNKPACQFKDTPIARSELNIKRMESASFSISNAATDAAVQNKYSPVPIPHT